MFPRGPRMDDAIVQLWYTRLLCEANKNVFHQLLESIWASRETHWHSKPFKGTKNSTESGEFLTGCVHWDLIKTCRHGDCRKKGASF